MIHAILNRREMIGEMGDNFVVTESVDGKAGSDVILLSILSNSFFSPNAVRSDQNSSFKFG